MTVFAICMTATAAFLLGFRLGERRKKVQSVSSKRRPKNGGTLEFSNDEYREFLNYDGSVRA